MSEKFTFNEFRELAHDLRIMMSQFFITKGVHITISWDSSLYITQDQEDFTWSATVKMRKFATTDGIIIKPNIKFSDINPIEGTYINSDHHTYYKYYNQFQEVFPRFLYNREMMRDEKENGVGQRFTQVFGKFRLHVKNNGELRVDEYVHNLFNTSNGNNNLYICNLEKLKMLMPEYEKLINIFQEHYTTPFSRVKKRNGVVEKDIYRVYSHRLYTALV
jgi:hypothetical protein